MKLTGRTSGTLVFWGPPKVNPSGRERESDLFADGGALLDTWITATYSVHSVHYKTEQEWSPSIRVAKYLHNMCSASKLVDNLDRAITTTCVLIIQKTI